MECRNCKFLSEPKTLREGNYPSVRCTLGLWDQKEEYKAGRYIAPYQRWYSFGNSQLNRGPVRRLGAACTQGINKRQ